LRQVINILKLIATIHLLLIFTIFVKDFIRIWRLAIYLGFILFEILFLLLPLALNNGESVDFIKLWRIRMLSLGESF